MNSQDAIDNIGITMGTPNTEPKWEASLASEVIGLYSHLIYSCIPVLFFCILIYMKKKNVPNHV